ncbi:glycoside hydrolase family 15 protein [Amycolatopsis sp. FBCC-B4732]|uniref:glycoside hydrolase family 15 protein n=1 Tax=Amycolatopsis sp. FBCC-B4732 TaxID=3079339 RepID=UPI001FF3E07A|nr:glycoside hydrolase family 15 protein [Amycolatopsis sp. FBCC-B4732]UOX90502.1 glycoside hydrolase family 15 protein [Amycolatopsis sp. FBCC-B4732]
MSERYLPIAEHGLIGDLRTAAVVGTDGGISWFCAPRFDSPSVFGALLDADDGGRWALHPVCEVTNRHQFYIPDSNILVTRFLTEDGIVEVQDFMPIRCRRDPEHRQRLVRRVVNIRGHVRLRTDVRPRFDYGRAAHRTETDGTGTVFEGPGLRLGLRTSIPLEPADGGLGGEFDLGPGDTAVFVLEVLDGDLPAGPLDDEVEDLFRATVGFWRSWIEQSTYTGRWREMVHRSALLLKLLTHEPSGAIIAAPTCGLPEQVGGERNWDYRHVWIRDAAFSLYALLRLGFTCEAEDFFSWLTDRFDDPGDGDLGPLRVMYTIDGEPAREEEVLDHWEGYRGSAPVRIGNAAARQLQLDIYGELIDSIYLFDKYSAGISHQAWHNLVRVLDWLFEHWDQPDEGIWEARSGRQDHTFSRLMCWVGIERMIRVARRRGLPADLGRWTSVRDEIYEQIQTRGWSAEENSFSQRYDGFAPDASLLLMPLVKFCSPTDPRFVSTMAALERSLVVDSLVFRYDPDEAPDGVDGAEGTFSICSFWYVEALARTGRVEDARLALEKMFTYANHVGLYAEQIGLTGDQLGNFPQAFTHLSLISSAINLDRALDG